MTDAPPPDPIEPSDPSTVSSLDWLADWLVVPRRPFRIALALLVAIGGIASLALALADACPDTSLAGYLACGRAVGTANALKELLRAASSVFSSFAAVLMLIPVLRPGADGKKWSHAMALAFVGVIPAFIASCLAAFLPPALLHPAVRWILDAAILLTFPFGAAMTVGFVGVMFRFLIEWLSRSLTRVRGVSSGA